MRHILLNTAADVLARWHRSSPARMINPSHARSIVAVESTRLGDVIAMLPVLASLRQHAPSATIGIVVRKEFASLFDMVPDVDVVISLQKPITPSHVLRLRDKIRRIETDLLLSMSPSHINAVLTLVSPSSAKVGYFRSHHSATPFLFDARIEAIGTRNLNPAGSLMQNLYRRAALVAESIGIPCASEPRWHIPPTIVQKTSEALSDTGLDIRDRIVVIHPFARWEHREWPLDRFITLARAITGQSQATVIFTGNVHMPEMNIQLREKLRAEPYMRVLHAPDLVTLAGLISRSHLFIGNDSGPLHLAASLGIPTLGLYGPAPPSLTAPPSTKHESIYFPVECSPCEQRTCSRQSGSCMPGIPVTHVVERALSLLDIHQPVTA